MAAEVETYTKFEGLENRLARVYTRFQKRFENQPELSQFWAGVALDEMEHSSMLRLCRQRGRPSTHSVAESVYKFIDILIESVESISEKPDLTVAEAFYAALLMEASELDDVYAQLIHGWLPDQLAAREALKEVMEANLRAHHERFAEAADRFLPDPAFGMAFRNLSKKHNPRQMAC